MTSTTHGARRLSTVVVGGLAASALLLSACSGRSTASSSSSSEAAPAAASSAPASAAASAAASSDALAAFEANVQKIIDDASADQTELPTTTGPKGQAGKKIVVIPPAGASTEGGYRVALAAEDAGKALGWDVTLINPEGDPTKMNAAVQQAIAMNADGIAISSIDAAVVANSLKQAQEKGIKVVAAVAGNSDGETGIYESLTPSLQSGADNGYALAAMAYQMTDGHMRDVQMMDNEFGYVRARQDGWKKFVADCQAAGGDCQTLATTDFLAADITTKLPALTAQTLRDNPDFNVLWSGFDSGLDFMLQGAEQAGLMTDGKIAVGFDGNTPNLEKIRKDGKEKATVGLSTLAIGYGMIDNLNRLFAGEQPVTEVEQAIKNKLITKDNVNPEGSWWGDQDIRQTYWDTWGVTPANPAPASDL